MRTHGVPNYPDPVSGAKAAPKRFGQLNYLLAAPAQGEYEGRGG
jgi:hypothetical protein